MDSTILHIADSHLAPSQYGDLRRGEDRANALLDTIRIAKEKGITTIINGGDILDQRTLYSVVDEQLEVLDQTLLEAGITMWVVSGNHDISEPSWIRQVEKRRTRHGIPADAPGLKSLDYRLVVVDGVRYYGLPTMSATELRATITGGGIPPCDVLVWHGAVMEFTGFPDPNDIRCEEFPTDRLKAVLLGDQHICKYQYQDRCLVGYPGSTGMCKKDEPLEKTATVIRITDDVAQVISYEPIRGRKALGWRLSTEEHMTKAIADLESMRGQKLLLFIRYSDQLENVTQRLARCFDPADVIMRAEPAPTPSLMVVDLLGGEEAAEDMAPEDMPAWSEVSPETTLRELFVDDPGLATLAGLLTNPQEKPAIIVASWSSKELAKAGQELELETAQ
jgi:hypothetical protein